MSEEPEEMQREVQPPRVSPKLHGWLIVICFVSQLGMLAIAGYRYLEIRHLHARLDEETRATEQVRAQRLAVEREAERLRAVAATPVPDVTPGPDLVCGGGGYCFHALSVPTPPRCLPSKMTFGDPVRWSTTPKTSVCELEFPWLIRVCTAVARADKSSWKIAVHDGRFATLYGVQPGVTLEGLCLLDDGASK